MTTERRELARLESLRGTFGRRARAAKRRLLHRRLRSAVLRLGAAADGPDTAPADGREGGASDGR